jgi:hypothetical protein
MSVRVGVRVAALVAVSAATQLALPSHAMAQRTDSHTWSLGLNAGIMAYQTHEQDTKVVPSLGAHALIVGGRGGLLVGVDEGIGTNERASQTILFNDIRRYQAVLMAFPVSGAIEPYFGGGGGLMQVVGPRVDLNVITNPADQDLALADARERSTSGFLTVLAGVQGRAGRVTVFAQYQATTSPADDKILKGATQSLLGGIRIGLGSAREGITNGSN